MNREIKYKVWDKKHKRMWDATITPKDIFDLGCDEAKECLTDCVSPNEDFEYAFEDCELLRYATKLFSGLELWEGDIVSYQAGGQEAGAQFYEFMGVVKYRNGGFCIYSNNSIRTQIPLMDINGNDEFLWYESGSLANSRKSYYICKDFKMVGNIYENGCDTCNGQGFYEVYHDDSEIVKGEATCSECNGSGFVIETPNTPDESATSTSDKQTKPVRTTDHLK